MNTWIVLLRGVNVVGKNKLPMKELAALLTKAGFSAVRTYVQSGNVVLQSAKGSARTVSNQIARLILERYGFEPRAVVLSAPELALAVRNNPFPNATENHKLLHLYFLSDPPAKPDLKLLTQYKTSGESFALKGSVFYLHTPNGFPDSKVAPRIERCLGVEATARNWRTATQLVAMTAAAE